MAIAWSYAAAVHLGLPATAVFHDGGYRGGGPNLVENFTAGRWVGVPMLRWVGLAADDYPRMAAWVPTGPSGGGAAPRRPGGDPAEGGGDGRLAGPPARLEERGLDGAVGAVRRHGVHAHHGE